MPVLVIVFSPMSQPNDPHAAYPPILEAASALQTFCEIHGWRFCFIGGLAVQRWGEPRQTQDADLTLITGFGPEESYVDSLLSRFAGRREDSKDFAMRFRVLLLHASNGIPLDIALGAMPFELNFDNQNNREGA